MDQHLEALLGRVEALEHEKDYLSQELAKWQRSARERGRIIEEIQRGGWIRLGMRLGLVERREVLPATQEMSALPAGGTNGTSGIDRAFEDETALPNWELRVGGGSEAHLIYPREDHEMVRVGITKVKARTEWSIQLNRPKLKVAGGVRYVLTFRARSARPRLMGVGFSKNHEPWSSLGLYAKFRLTPEWQTITEEFAATEDDDNGRIHFDLGGEDIGVDLTSVTLNAAQVREGMLRQGKTA